MVAKILQKSLWPSCLTCWQSGKLDNNFCNLQCLKYFFILYCQPYNSLPCQHPLRDEKGVIVNWKDDCNCEKVLKSDGFFNSVSEIKKITNSKSKKWHTFRNKVRLNTLSNIQKREIPFYRKTIERLSDISDSETIEILQSLTCNVAHLLFQPRIRSNLLYLTLTFRNKDENNSFDFSSSKLLFETFASKITTDLLFSVIEQHQDESYHFHLVFIYSKLSSHSCQLEEKKEFSCLQCSFDYESLWGLGFISIRRVGVKRNDYYNVIYYMVKNLVKLEYFFQRVYFLKQHFSKYLRVISDYLKEYKKKHFGKKSNLFSKTLVNREQKKVYDASFYVKNRRRLMQDIRRREIRVVKFKSNFVKRQKLLREIKLLNVSLSSLERDKKQLIKSFKS